MVAVDVIEMGGAKYFVVLFLNLKFPLFFTGGSGSRNSIGRRKCSFYGRYTYFLGRTKMSIEISREEGDSTR